MSILDTDQGQKAMREYNAKQKAANEAAQDAIHGDPLYQQNLGVDAMRKAGFGDIGTFTHPKDDVELVWSRKRSWSSWSNTLLHLACLVSYAVFINLVHVLVLHPKYQRFHWYSPKYAVAVSLIPTPASMYMSPELHNSLSSATGIFHYTSIPLFIVLILIYAQALLFGPDGICCTREVNHKHKPYEGDIKDRKPIETELDLEIDCLKHEGYGFAVRGLANFFVYVAFGPLCMYLLGYKSAAMMSFSLVSFVLLAAIFASGDYAMSELRVRVDVSAAWMETPLVSALPIILLGMLLCVLATVGWPMYWAFQLAEGGGVPTQIRTLIVLFGVDIMLESVSFLISLAFLFMHAVHAAENQPFFASGDTIWAKQHLFNFGLSAYKCAWVCAFIMLLNQYAFGVLNSDLVL